MKKAFFKALLVASILVCSVPGKSNDLSWYSVSTSHPAYMTALSFNSDPDFIRGFCYAWDGLKEWVNFGTGSIMMKEVPVGNNLTITIGMYGISTAYWNSVATTCAQSSEGVRQYALSLTNLQDQSLWLGYATLMEQAAGNPNIVNLQPGQSW